MKKYQGRLRRTDISAGLNVHAELGAGLGDVRDIDTDLISSLHIGGPLCGRCELRKCRKSSDGERKRKHYVSYKHWQIPGMSVHGWFDTVV